MFLPTSNQIDFFNFDMCTLPNPVIFINEKLYSFTVANIDIVNELMQTCIRVCIHTHIYVHVNICRHMYIYMLPPHEVNMKNHFDMILLINS